MKRNTQKARAARGDDRSNGGDKVVKILRVYKSGKVRAARTPPGGWEAKGRAHALPADVTDKPTLAEATGERVKNPAKVAAGKARAAKAALAKAAGLGAVLPAVKTKKAKAAKVKAKATKKPARKVVKPSPFPTAAKTKPPKSAKPKTKAAKGKKTRNPPSDTAMVVVAFRVTPAQKRKLGKLGGGEFMRDKIDRATIQAK